MFFSKVALNVILSILSSVVLVSAIDQNNCEPIAKLGTADLNRYNYTTEFATNNSGFYTLDIKFKHDSTQPLPTDVPNQCNPGIAPPAIASDGLPYFAFRWAYESVSEEIKQATGIDHISVDFNPCGHPPLSAFGYPHYDLHIYLKTPDYRRCMTCVKSLDSPACDPSPGAQTTSNGKGFFNVTTVKGSNQPSNIPANFTVGMLNMIPLMGGHAWDQSKQPNFDEGKPWINPVWLMGTYGGFIIDYEPMIPLSFHTGDEDMFYEEELRYEGQTMKELPTKYSVRYDSKTKLIALHLEGNIAEADKEEERSDRMDQLPSGASPVVEIGSAMFLFIVTICVLLVHR